MQGAQKSAEFIYRHRRQLRWGERESSWPRILRFFVRAMMRRTKGQCDRFREDGKALRW